MLPASSLHPMKSSTLSASGNASWRVSSTLPVSTTTISSTTGGSDWRHWTMFAASLRTMRHAEILGVIDHAVSVHVEIRQKIEMIKRQSASVDRKNDGPRIAGIVLGSQRKLASTDPEAPVAAIRGLIAFPKANIGCRSG